MCPNTKLQNLFTMKVINQSLEFQDLLLTHAEPNHLKLSLDRTRNNHLARRNPKTQERFWGCAGASASLRSTPALTLMSYLQADREVGWYYMHGVLQTLTRNPGQTSIQIHHHSHHGTSAGASSTEMDLFLQGK